MNQDSFNKIRFFPDVLDHAGENADPRDLAVNVMQVYNHGLQLFADVTGINVPDRPVKVSEVDDNTKEAYLRIMRVCTCLMMGLSFQEEQLGNQRELEALRTMRDHDAFEHAANYGFFVGMVAGLQLVEPKYNKPDGEFTQGEVDPHFVNFMLDAEVLGSQIMRIRELMSDKGKRKSILEVESQKATARKLVRNLNQQLKDLYKYFEIDPEQN